MATSATGGPLVPEVVPTPLEGVALRRFFQQWFYGLLGGAAGPIKDENIRPRWQAEAPVIPDISVNWLSFGITKKTADSYAVELHDPSGDGYNELRRHKDIPIALSMYGPDAEENLERLRDGMQVAQNREILSINGIGLTSSGDIFTFPEMIKNRWYNRSDMEVTFKQQVKRHYKVLNLESAQVNVHNELYQNQIIVEE